MHRYSTSQYIAQQIDKKPKDVPGGTTAYADDRDRSASQPNRNVEVLNDDAEQAQLVCGGRASSTLHRIATLYRSCVTLAGRFRTLSRARRCESDEGDGRNKSEYGEHVWSVRMVEQRAIVFD